jgi:hypothetical protein
VTISNQYLENALLSLQQGEAGKASELLWGSIAEALQAVAASRSMHLKNHRSLRHFASQLAKEIGDQSINGGFARAERLHSNFHEVELEPEDVAAEVDPIREAVSKLLKLIPDELLVIQPGQSESR